MTEMHWMSATELADALDRRELSSREAVDHAADRIARLDGPINAVVLTDLERAKNEAGAIDDERAAGAELGPLAGVPMTIKDSFSTKGMVTTSGSPTLADHVPTEDAWPVAAMRSAGAVVIGKTNLPIWAGDLQSYNEVYGTTSNPYDIERTPGGSSGGSAAALASGFTPLEIGSDIGGSIRIPSHMAGVVGHKPSYGVVPAHGQIPGPPGTLTLADLAVAGPMARSVADLELGLELMAGPNRWEHPAWRLELPPTRATDASSFRVAAWLDDDHCPIDSESRTMLEGLVELLRGQGATVADDARPSFSLEKVATTFHALLQAALAGGESRETIEVFAADEGTGFASNARRSLGMRHREWLSNNERRLQMRRQWETFFEDYDVMLMPVCMLPALRHDHSEPFHGRTLEVNGESRSYWEMITWMAPAGACYLPATVVPVGLTASGLPVGVQIVGPYLNDKTTLAFAQMVTDVVGPLPRPTGF